MEWAIVMYAILMTSDGIKEDITWGPCCSMNNVNYSYENKLDIQKD